MVRNGNYIRSDLVAVRLVLIGQKHGFDLMIQHNPNLNYYSFSEMVLLCHVCIRSLTTPWYSTPLLSCICPAAPPP